MPGYDSLSAAYKLLGWKQHKGRTFAPDPYARQKRRSRSMGKRGTTGKTVKDFGNESIPPCRLDSASAGFCNLGAETHQEQPESALLTQEAVQRKSKACNREFKTNGGKMTT